MPRLMSLQMKEVIDEENRARTDLMSNFNKQIRYFTENVKPKTEEDVTFEGKFRYNLDKILVELNKLNDEVIKVVNMKTQYVSYRLGHTLSNLLINVNNFLRLFRYNKITNTEYNKEWFPKIQENEVIEKIEEIIELYDTKLSEINPRFKGADKEVKYGLKFMETLNNIVRNLKDGIFTEITNPTYENLLPKKEEEAGAAGDAAAAAAGDAAGDAAGAAAGDAAAAVGAGKPFILSGGRFSPFRLYNSDGDDIFSMRRQEI